MSMTLGSLFGMATADHNDSAITAFAEAFEQAQAVLSRRIRIGTFWALFELSGDRMVAPMKTIRAFVGPLVDAAIRAREERSGASRTLLDHLVSMISGMWVDTAPLYLSDATSDRSENHRGRSHQHPNRGSRHGGALVVACAYGILRNCIG